MVRTSRRNFLRTSLAAGALASTGTLPIAAAAPQGNKATDLVTLGKSNIRATRLAFGTGTNNGAVQRRLGQDGFNALVRHAYDRGIRFFETCDTYTDMHRMLGVALRGIPRDSYVLLSKITTDSGDPHQRFDDLRRQANTDYFDIMLLHVQQGDDWPQRSRRWQDAISEAQQKKIILARGASVHGLPALRQVPQNTWLQVAMIRMNHTGQRMDNEATSWNQLGDVPEVVQHVHAAKAAGMGVLSMKLIGEGVFNQQDRQKAMRFAFRNAGVDCVTVGYKAPNEIDEAIDNINAALA
ncbi:MAG TPA: aldo/keto reductase [Acidobacteriaceae bacterium]|nr:aldo/keto reductase [Acidobacteriaceae bacterium]